MAKIKYDIYNIDAESLVGFDNISAEDSNILSEIDITKTFDPTNHFIELSYFSLDDVELATFPNYKDYSILSGGTLDGTDGNTEISIDVEQDYLKRGFETEEVKVLYNFLNYAYSDSSNPQDFYIESISPDRKELRLISVDLDDSTVEEISDTIIDKYENDTYIPELYLYFENNLFLNIVNLQKEFFQGTSAVLVKLYNPLPGAINTKVRLNVVEKIGDPVAYEINTTIEPEVETIPFLRGPNFAVEIDSQNVEPSKYFNYNELFSFPVNNTYRQLNSLFSEKGAELGIDYSDFSYFINFSSAEERLRNFKYKLDLIESHQANLDIINETSNNYSAAGITGSRHYYENLIEGLLNNLDHYERHLYYESGSTSWPKVQNSTVPHINQLSSTEEAESFFNSEIEDAILYDAQNQDLLANTIPSFLREDEDNRPYEVFIHMIAQHFDNLWVYTDAVSKKYDADNRLDRGVSKDLIEELLKNFGVKLYTSNRSLEDLFRYFTFDSYDLGEESSASIRIAQPDRPLSQKDYQKSIYKRIYHNLSLLMKSKGTERGLRALINCFGIPSDILKIKIFGGQDAKDLPYFGGEQQFTGSLDKVRLNNTGSIVPGDTISYYTSILNYSNDYTQDLHRIEVGFSPADNIDNYIVSQSAVLFPNDPFNIDQYIGDPRQSLTNRYEELKIFSKTIFEDVTEYNVKDFVRLIKFFDNVIFRMIKDFTPARAVTDSGIIIKPHLLDRSKAISPQMTWIRSEYSGSIDTAFIEGGNAGIFKQGIVESDPSLEYSTDYLRVTMTPSGSSPRRINQFNTFLPDEKPQIEKQFGEVKFDGEFQNSFIRVSNGELNQNNPYKQIDYPEILYHTQFYNQIPDNICILTLPSTGSFPVRPNVITNIPSSNIFIGDTATAYTFTVDGESPNQDDGINHIFEGLQYTEATVRAENNDSTINNSATNESGCSAERNVVIVACDIDTSTGTPANPVGLNVPYNLFNFFFTEPTLNTNLTFFVNGENVGSLTEGEDSLIHTVTDSALSQVFLEVQDSFDPTCKKFMTIPFSSCPLTVPERARIAPIGDLDPELTGFVHFPFGIQGVTPLTEMKFQIYVIYNSNGNPSFTDFETDFISNEVRINNPLPEQAESTVGISLASSIPTTYALLVEKFRNTNVGQLTTPITVISSGVSTNGLDPFSNTSTNPMAVIQGDHDEYLFAALGNTSIFRDRNYRRYIRFIADNGDIDGAPCNISSNFYSMDDTAVYHKVAVDINYDSMGNAVSPNGNLVGPVCMAANPSTVTVYARVVNTVTVVTALDVVQQALHIYKNAEPSDTTPADRGAYFTGGNLVTGGYYAGRKGRLWRYNTGTGTSSGWDEITVGDYPPNTSGGQVSFSPSNPGYFYCTNPGGNDTGGVDDATIDDIDVGTGEVDNNPVGGNEPAFGSPKN